MGRAMVTGLNDMLRVRLCATDARFVEMVDSMVVMQQAYRRWLLGSVLKALADMKAAECLDTDRQYIDLQRPLQRVRSSQIGTTNVKFR
jgi:hypothetical protein